MEYHGKAPVEDGIEHHNGEKDCSAYILPSSIDEEMGDVDVTCHDGGRWEEQSEASKQIFQDFKAQTPWPCPGQLANEEKEIPHCRDEYEPNGQTI